MDMKNCKLVTLIGLVLMLMVPALAFALPSVHDIYVATQNGDYNGAESMVKQVLRVSPNNAKAHWVAANVYYQAGDTATAKTEFARAEALNPTDSFATAQSVQTLRNELNPPVYTNTNHGVLFFLFILVLIAGFIWFIARLLESKRTTMVGADTPTPNVNLNYGSSVAHHTGHYSSAPRYTSAPVQSGPTIINNTSGGNDGLLTGVLVGEALAGNHGNTTINETVVERDDRDFGTNATPTAPESVNTGNDFGTSTTPDTSSDTSSSTDFGTSSDSNTDFGGSGSDSSSDFGSDGGDSSSDFGSSGDSGSDW